MALSSVIGLDHVVVLTRNLDAGEAQWRGLGFTISHRGIHSAVMGTANHTIMLDEDYLELIGVLTETERNAPSRAFLARRGEGMERAAFTARDAQGGIDELKTRGITATGPFPFGRPVDLPDGSQTEARFRTFLWPVEERPGDLRIFACEHQTRDAVWLPHLMRHANTAYRIDRLEILALKPTDAAAHMSRLIDRPITKLDDGALEVESGGNRARFVFMDRATLAARHPGVPLDTLPAEGGVAIVLNVRDAKATAAAVGDKASVATASRVEIPPTNANGVILTFEQR